MFGGFFFDMKLTGPAKGIPRKGGAGNWGPLVKKGFFVSALGDDLRKN